MFCVVFFLFFFWFFFVVLSLTRIASLASKDIRSRLRDATTRMEHYSDLEWRLDVELASRTVHRQTNPVWLFELHTIDSNGEERSQTLQTDGVNLKVRSFFFCFFFFFFLLLRTLMHT